MSAALDKAATGKVFAGHSKLNYGRYRLRIQAHRLNEGFHGNYLIAETKVITAEPLGTINVPEGATPAPTEPLSPVGSAQSYTENIDNPKKGGPDRFQTHLARVFGNDEPFNTPQLRFITGYEDPTGGKQPAFGIDVDVEVTPKWMPPDPKKNYLVGKWLKNHRWSTVDPLDQPLPCCLVETQPARRLANS
jgi:hypothetical protein